MLSIKYANAIEKVTVISINGQIVKDETYAKGTLNPSINLGGLSAGTYTIKVIDADGKSGIQKVTKQ